MSQNRELILALQRILKDSEFILKELAGPDVNENNYKDYAYNTNSTSGCVIEGLFEVREYLEDAIEQYDF